MASASTDLECPTCRNFFSELKRLTCMHTFCDSCLKSNVQEQKPNDMKIEQKPNDTKIKEHKPSDTKIEEQKPSDTKIECPICKCITVGEITDLPNNLRVRSLLKTSANQQEDFINIKCQGCNYQNQTAYGQHQASPKQGQASHDDQHRAVSGCRDCDHFLCEGCDSAHKTMFNFKQHRKQVYRLDKLQSGEIADMLKNLNMQAGTFKCSRKDTCQTCVFIKESTSFTSYTTGESYDTRGNITCTTSNVIYLISFTKSRKQCVWETQGQLRDAFCTWKCLNKKRLDLSDITLQGIETWHVTRTPFMPKAKWVKKLGTSHPDGLN